MARAYSSLFKRSAITVGLTNSAEGTDGERTKKVTRRWGTADEHATRDRAPEARVGRLAAVPTPSATQSSSPSTESSDLPPLRYLDRAAVEATARAARSGCTTRGVSHLARTQSLPMLIESSWALTWAPARLAFALSRLALCWRQGWRV